MPRFRFAVPSSVSLGVPPSDRSFGGGGGGRMEDSPGGGDDGEAIARGSGLSRLREPRILF